MTAAAVFAVELPQVFPGPREWIIDTWIMCLRWSSGTHIPPPIFWSAAIAVTALLLPFAGGALRWLRNPEVLGRVCQLLYLVVAFGGGLAGAIPRTQAGLLGFLAAFVAAVPPSVAQIRQPARVSIDAPLLSIEDDKLGRSDFTQLVYRQLTLSTARCPRIGLVSPVGTGKTTVANFVASQLRSNGHRVVFVDAWRFRTPQIAQQAVLAAIDDELAQLRGFSPTLVRVRIWLRRIWHAVTFRFGWLEAFTQPVEGRIELGRLELTRILASALPFKKSLVIIVDDLERASSDVCHSLLVESHTLLDVPGLSYLFVFDADTCEHEHGISTDLRTKILDCELAIPPPPPDSLAGVRGDCARRLGTRGLPAASFESDLKGLDPNVRDHKRFVYFASSWVEHLGSVPKMLNADYLVALLLLERHRFGTLRWIWARELQIQELDTGLLRAVMRAGTKSGNQKPSPELPPCCATKGGMAAYEQARELGDKNRNTTSHIGWLLGEGVERENEQYHSLVELFNDPSVMKSQLQKLVTDSKDVPPTFAAALRAFHLLMGHAADNPDQTVRDSWLRRAELCVDLLDTLTDDEAAARDALTPELFLRTFGSFSSWAGFGGPYEVPVGQMFDLLKKVADRAGLRALGYWEKLEEASPLEQPNVVGARNALWNILEPQIGAQILELFVVRDGIDSVSYATSNWGVHAYLFDRTNTFFQPKYLCEMARISTRAANEPVVWANLFRFWELIFRAAEHDRPGAVAACQDDSWLPTIWGGIVERKLNRRHIGSVEKHRELLVKKGWTLERLNLYLPLPEWWFETIDDAEKRWGVD